MLGYKKLTQFLQRGLVSIRLGDFLSRSLGLGDLGLKGEYPAVTLRSRGLEVQIASRQLQHKFVRTGLGNLSYIGQLDDSMRNLVCLILGIEPQTLSSLKGICRSCLGMVVLVKVSLQALLIDGLILEVEEPLNLEETICQLVSHQFILTFEIMG